MSVSQAEILASIAAHIGTAIGGALEPRPAARVAGGCIDECHRWRSDKGELFVKVAPAQRQVAHATEAAGLAELHAAGALRVPRVRAVGVTEHRSFLALEWLDLAAPGPGSGAVLGAGLARQHRVTAPLFGWHTDNAIGGTPQINTRSGDWIAFFRDQRLGAQLALAAGNGYGGRLQRGGERLRADLGQFFGACRPAPALLHGDLWGGNWAVEAGALRAPVIFDPAVYHGDRETDIAMTRLFGGFSRDFYAAYQAEWPLDAGAAARTSVYNLYHVLNHLNLFGGAYLSQAESMIDGLIAELAG
jgi:fructosamine-3-kinase